MNRSFAARSPWIPIVSLSLAACGGSEGNGAETHRRDVLASLTQEVILPNHADLAATAAALPPATAALCETPNGDTLEVAKAAWRAIRIPLKRGEAFAFGPIEDERIGSAIDFWPARPEIVESTIAMDEDPTAAWIDGLGVAGKGLPAIEYLLWGDGARETELLAALDPGDAAGSHRCAYLLALAEDVARKTVRLRDAWAPEGDDFAGELSRAGAGSERYTTAHMGLSELVNRVIFLLQNGSDTKLGVPLGSKTGGTPLPERVESRFSGNAVAELVANLEGFDRVYQGTPDGLGLTDLVSPRSSELDARIRDQSEKARASLLAIEEPLDRVVVEDPLFADLARGEVYALRRLVEVDVANLLGIIVTLNDNDGD